MKEIVILSGKGGTGKTSISASFAHLEGTQAAIADCDVDASDLHLLLKPTVKISEEFYGGYEAVIEPDGCIGCGICADGDQKDYAGCPVQAISKDIKVSPSEKIEETETKDSLEVKRLHKGCKAKIPCPSEPKEG